VFHQLRSHAFETWNGQLNGLFDCTDRVPTRGLAATRRFVVGAVLVYRLVLLHRLALGADLRVGPHGGSLGGPSHNVEVSIGLAHDPTPLRQARPGGAPLRQARPGGAAARHGIQRESAVTCASAHVTRLGPHVVGGPGITRLQGSRLGRKDS
jgi:hypothetical protein